MDIERRINFMRKVYLRLRDRINRSKPLFHSRVNDKLYQLSTPAHSIVNAYFKNQQQRRELNNQISNINFLPLRRIRWVATFRKSRDSHAIFRCSDWRYGIKSRKWILRVFAQFELTFSLVQKGQVPMKRSSSYTRSMHKPGVQAVALFMRASTFATLAVFGILKTRLHVLVQTLS